MVVNTASSVARISGEVDPSDFENAKKHHPQKAYGDAKLDDILFTRGLVARHGAERIRPGAFDPGTVATNFASDTTSWMRFVHHTPLARLASVSPEKGGADLAFFINGSPGATWRDGGLCTPQQLSTEKQTDPQVHDDALIDALRERTLELVSPHGATAK